MLRALRAWRTGLLLIAGSLAVFDEASLHAQSSSAPRAGNQESAAAPRAGIAVGELTWAAGPVVRAEPPDKQTWKPVAAGDKLRTGDTLRTGELAVATVEFPWMQVSLGPTTMLTIPATAVLSTVMDYGRAEFAGAGRDIVKIVVGGGEVRGGGRLVLRRSAGQTTASALKGAFRVRAAGRLVEIKAGEGTVVRDGAPPTPASALPAAPAELRPGAEVSYVRAGRPISLAWASAAATAYHIEVLQLQDERVLLARDAAASPAHVEMPWLGTYRWRVFARDNRGLESVSSREGLLAVVEK